MNDASQSALSFGAEQTLRAPTPLRILKIRTALRNPLRDRQAPLNPKQALNQLYYLLFRFQFEIIDFAPLRSVKKRINRFIVQ